MYTYVYICMYVHIYLKYLANDIIFLQRVTVSTLYYYEGTNSLLTSKLRQKRWFVLHYYTCK